MSEPTSGQLEREISHRLQALLQAQNGQRPSRIICQFFDKTLAITVDNSVTQAEQTLMHGGCEKLAEEVRTNLDKLIQPPLKQMAEEIIGKPVLDVIINTTLTTGRTGIIFVLEDVPTVRNPESIPKAKY